MDGILIVAVIALVVLFLSMNVVVIRVRDAQDAHISDRHRAITPELVAVWKKQITNHELGSKAYE